MPAKPKKSTLNPAVVIALIGLTGTLITAMFTSPVLIELIKRSGATATSVAPTSVPPSSATLVFTQNFEDGTTSGLALKQGTWKVVRDRSNRVLEFAASGSDWPGGTLFFGPSDLSDFVIEFQVKFTKLSGLYLNFHEQENGDSYVVSFDPDESVIVWATNMFDGTNWQFSPVGRASTQPFTFQPDVWYSVRVEMRGEQVVVDINGNRTVSGSDSLFSNGSLRFELRPNAVILLDDIKVWSLDQ